MRLYRPTPGYLFFKGIAIATPAAIALWVVIVGVLVLVGACSSAPKPAPTVEIQKVEIPVITPCVPRTVKDGKVDHYPDENVAADPDPASRYLRIARANEMRAKRLAVVEPVIAVCP